MTEPDKTQNKRGRTLLIALALLFIGPLALAWTVYMTGIWRPGAGTNHGELIQPVLTLPRAALPTPDGGQTEGGYLYGKWSLVHLTLDTCGDNCRDAIVKTRQIRFAMLREADRVQRVLFVAGEAPLFPADAQTDLIVVQLTGDTGNEIRTALLDNGGAARIFLVDPIGNLILSYALDVNPADIRDDLKRLLRISRIG